MRRDNRCIALLVAVVTLTSGRNQPVWGIGSKSDGSGSSSPTAHEVGDIVVFGPAGTEVKEIGHSAMLHYQELDGGVWKDRVIDSMPPPDPGVTVNHTVWGTIHGDFEKIFTVPSLADGSWSAARQLARMNLVARAVSHDGEGYSLLMPINGSDVAWTQLTALSGFISAYEALDPSYPGTFAIQADSTYATPPGAVDYRPYQLGGNPGANKRYTCCGFTERVYEEEGLDITPAASTYTHSLIEIKPQGGSIWWDVGYAWTFWPKTQADNGTTSVPKPPEVAINTPANDKWHKVNAVGLKGYANDVSNMRDDKVNFKVAYQADSSPATVSMEFAVTYFAGPGQETTFDDTHTFSDDGHYKIGVDSYDGAGNHAVAFNGGSTEFIVKIDTKKPTGTIAVTVSP